MIRTPGRKPKRCDCGWCNTCSDDLVRYWETRNRNGWATADLRANRREPATVLVDAAIVAPVLPPLPKRPPRTAPSLAASDRDMAALRARVRGDGAQPRTRDRGDR